MLLPRHGGEHGWCWVWWCWDCRWQRWTKWPCAKPYVKPKGKYPFRVPTLPRNRNIATGAHLGRGVCRAAGRQPRRALFRPKYGVFAARFGQPQVQPVCRGVPVAQRQLAVFQDADRSAVPVEAAPLLVAVIAGAGQPAHGYACAKPTPVGARAPSGVRLASFL